MRKAKARHLLVPTEEECKDIKLQIENGADFLKWQKNIRHVHQGVKAVEI